ncbi:MAG: outer membrane protein assembly factor BamA [Alphaproteobacteria bacterium]|nr:outer membrane protein assembly factor BamA [Alphaproteobacteria bacterium]
MRRALLAAWLAAASVVAGVAAPVAHAGELVPARGEIAEVVVRGTRWIEEAAVLARIGLHPGEELTPDKVRRDLKSVYGTGFFQDVQILLEPRSDGRVRVVFQVVEKPAVVDVRIEGNKKIETEDLNELIDVKSFGVLNEAKVQETVGLLRDKYVEKGFYLAEITPEIRPSGENRVEVVFKIVENRKVRVQRVEFTGNDHVPSRKIKKYMRTKEGGPVPWLTNSGTFDRDVLEADQQVVQYVMLEEGYLEARVDPPKVYLSPDKKFIYVSFHIEEGPQYTIGDIDVRGDFSEEEGLTEEVVREIIAGRPVVDVEQAQWRVSEGRKPGPPSKRKGPAVETGDTFQQSTVGAVAQAVSQLYQDRGYAFVNVIPNPIPHHDDHTADLRFRIERGERQRIGRIRITGNDPTLDKVIRREILLNEGELYRGSLLEASRLRLMRLGFFEDVQLSTPKGDGDDVLDVNVKATERPTGSFSLGVGFGTAEGFAINGSIQKNNFLGLGYLVNASINWSQRQRNIDLLFADPYFLDSRWTFQVSGFWRESAYLNQVPEYRRGASLGFGRYLDRSDDLTLQLRYTIEDVGLRSVDASRKRLYGGELFKNGLTSSLALSFIADKRNDRVSATKGVYATVAATLAGGFRVGDKVVSLLGGDFNFVQLDANFRFYQPLIPDKDLLVFRFNTQLGFIWSTDGDIIPLTHRYGAGGINSVRGFQLFSLGPRVRTSVSDDPTRGDTSVIIRGTQLWLNNIEIEAMLIRPAGIKAVVFFDAGNTFGDAYGQGGITFRDLRTSMGFGIRWQSPIGPLRFELGFPLAPREDEKRSQFDFTIGSFF